MYHYIYKTTNTVNNKVYIGVHSSDTLDDTYYGSGRYILKAISKYGKDKFTREILHVYDTRREALDKEKELVDEIFVMREDTYNATIGGGGFMNPKGLGAGRKLSAETRFKMSESAKGKTYSAETISKISASKIGNNYRKGMKNSADHNRKVSEALTGRKCDQIECNKCGKIGGVNVMKRWHFDNCRVV